MVKGPCRYIPNTKVEVIEKRGRIALDKNEGIYIRNVKTGEVKLHQGETYMLKAHEELWEMDVSKDVRHLLKKANCMVKNRNRTLAVKYQVPFNSAVQIYDYKSQTSKVVFGPKLVMLNPDE